MSNYYTRREVFKTLGLAIGSVLPLPLLAQDENGHPLHLPAKEGPKTTKTITAITLGAGDRGNIYGNYALA